MEEPMRNKTDRMETLRLFLRNNGFYVVLVIGLIVIGGAILLMALPETQEREAKAPATSDPIVIVGQSADQRIDEILRAPTAAPKTPAPLGTPVPLPALLPEPTPVPTAKAASTTSKAAPPVDGEVIFGFAVDKLLYSVTLDQWTTHAAVDIAANAGTPVRCVFSGTVKEAGRDDALGCFVRVEHANGRSTLYANLGEDLRVRVGDRVNAGDPLGTVGTSAISECALKPHVHFAVFENGVPKDPAKYVRLR